MPTQTSEERNGRLRTTVKIILGKESHYAVVCSHGNSRFATAPIRRSRGILPGLSALKPWKFLKKNPANKKRVDDPVTINHRRNGLSWNA
jgi:hypothetical protein